MKGINLEALDEVVEDIKEESGGANFVKQKDMAEEWDVRLIEPLSNMNGLFFLRERAFWIAKKRYISPKTFGEPCPMMDEVMKALETGEKDLRKLVIQLDYNKESTEFKDIMNTSYKIPVFGMKVDTKGEITRDPEDKTTVLECTTQLAEAIFKLVKHRNYKGEEAGVPWYINDAKKGFNITLTRSKKKNNPNQNEYDAAAGSQCAMPEWVNDVNRIYDIVTKTKERMYSNEYLRAVMRNYLYGEQLPKDPEARFTENEIKNQLPVEVEDTEKKAPAKKETKEVSMKAGTDSTPEKKEKTTAKQPAKKEKEPASDVKVEEEKGGVDDDLKDL